MVSDKIAKEIGNFEKARFNPFNKFVSGLKWYHYVGAVLFVCFIVYLIYSSSVKSKFTTDEKTDVFNSLRAYAGISENETTSIMTKVDLAGKVNTTAIAFIAGAIILILLIILGISPPQDLTFNMAMLILQKNLEISTGYAKQFPMGTVFRVGPVGKKMRQGTVGLSAMVPYKYVILLTVRYPNFRYASFIGSIEYPTGVWEGLVPVGKDELDKEFRDVKIIQPRELYLMSASKRGGAPMQWATEPGNSPFYSAY
jgi:hypothetical protein